MRFAKVLLTAFLVALLLASCGNNAPKAPNATTRLSAYVGPSIAYISTTFEGTVITDAGLYLGEEDKEAEVFTVTSACTGFAVGDEGHIATAGHCVDPKEAEQGIVDASVDWGVDYLKGKATAEDFFAEGLNVETADPDSRKEGADRVSVTVAFGADEDQQHKARVLKFRTASRGDTAILKIENDELLPAKIADSSSLDVGTEVVSIGYPGKVDRAVDADFAPSFKDGEVSSKKTREGGLFSVFEVSSALSSGMSGGPTVTLDGKIVGFNSLVAVDGEEKSEQFGFIGTSDQILELMNDVGVKNDVGALGRSYKKGLDAYFEGDKEEAVAALQTVVDEGPDNETTKDYLAKAKKLPDPAPIGLYIGVGAAVLAVIVAVSILLMRRGRNKGGSPTPPSSLVTTPLGDQKPTAIETPVDPNACRSCGSTLSAGAKFCPNCGSPTA